MAEILVKEAADIDPALRHIKQLPVEAQKQFKAALERSVLVMEREVAERTPVGATGHLRSAIFSEVRTTPEEMAGLVFTPSEHAPFVEFDTKPHWAPPGALADWVHFVLGVPQDEVPSVEYVVRRAIAQRGTKGKRMFEKGSEASEGRVRGFMLSAFRNAPRIAYQ